VEFARPRRHWLYFIDLTGGRSAMMLLLAVHILNIIKSASKCKPAKAFECRCTAKSKSAFATGEIKVETEEGKFTAFVARLPLHRNPF
jgi:hypothetical protein